MVISSGCEGAGFLSDPVFWKNDTLSLMLVPGQMFSLSRMEGLKKRANPSKENGKKKKTTQGKFRRKISFPEQEEVQCNAALKTVSR